MKSTFLISLWVSLGVLSPLLGQSLGKGHYFEGGFHFGHVFKHRSYITIPIEDIRHSYGGELSWEFHSRGRLYWQEQNNFPRMGLALSFLDFGDERLGIGLGLMPFINLKFFRIGKFEMFGRLAMGIGYVSRRWDSQNNPENNIIGSYINNNTGIRLGFSIDLGKNIELRPSFSFTHFSNGGSQFPNLGINVPAFHLGLLYKNNPLQADDYQRRSVEELPQRIKGLQVSLSSGVGMKEIPRTLRGPKYLVTATSIDFGLFLSAHNRIKLGLTHEYNPSVESFLRHNGGSSPQEAALAAQGFLFYVEDEVLFGRLGLSAQLGYYFTRPIARFPFTRIGLRYYLLLPREHRIAPYIGIRMKSHVITAEYFDIVIGAALR